MTEQLPLQNDDLVVELGSDHRPSSDDNVVLLLPGTENTSVDLERPLVVRLREALDASNEMILVVEPSGRVLFANRTARERLGLADADARFRAVEQLLSGARREQVWAALADDREWRGDVSTSRADGSTIHLQMTLLPDDTTTGDIHSLTVVAHDVGEQRALETALEHRSTHDGLTGLANRQHLLREINRMLPELESRQQPAALLLIDIDEFRTVTNSLGHEAGDRVLIAFAYRLLRTFPTNALLARVGGDEFAVFSTGSHDVDMLADQMDRTTAAPFYIDGTEVHLSIVTGIAVSTPEEPADNAEALLRKADAATYRAKERGRGTYELFEPQLQTDAVDRLSVVQDLRRALRNDELRIHYQPKIALRTGRIVGAEALMRWQLPDGELRGPSAFMQIAEDTGLIIPMGQWLLRRVCEEAAQLQAAVPDDSSLELSVNLSVRQLDHPSFAGDVEDALKASGVNPRLIEFEITESALMEDVETNAALLARLKELGTRVAVDDFGTGYSSLQYLQQFPVDVLKIDRTFVAGIEEREGDQAITRAIIEMAHALRLISVAEGVETQGQLDRLREFGCDQAQGYHFARPMPIGDLRAVLAAAPTW